MNNSIKNKKLRQEYKELKRKKRLKKYSDRYNAKKYYKEKPWKLDHAYGCSCYWCKPKYKRDNKDIINEQLENYDG